MPIAVMLRDRLRRIAFRAIPPTQTEKHTEDRLKALAGGMQNIALSVAGLGIVTPFFTAGGFDLRTASLAFLAGAVIESVSLLLLAYIPYPETKEEPPHG